MAIKLPDPGNGIPEQKTGNDEWTNMKIVRDNFADQSNAASRLVGVRGTDIPSGADILESIVSSAKLAPSSADTPPVPFSGHTTVYTPSTGSKPPSGGSYWTVLALRVDETGMRYEAISRTSPEIKAFRGLKNDVFTPWHYYYSTANTTKDGNGFLKAASPVVDLYDDKIELNGDAEMQGIEFVKNGTGDYTLNTKTGLRSDNTWRIEIPNDDNRNPLFAVDIDAKDDGTINIRCYKRIFNMQTFMFEPDLDSPVDITEDRFISVRLNDNPEPEQTDEPDI